MNVVVVEPKRPEREGIARLLTNCGHVVRQAADAKSALALVRSDAPDVVLTEWSLPGAGGLDLVRTIRATPTKYHVYCLVTSARCGPADIASVFAAGADDFLRKPIFKEELLARLVAPDRIRGWAGRLRPASAQDLSGGFDVKELKAWRLVESVVSTDVGEMLGSEFEIDTGAALDRACLGARIPLTLATENTDFTLTVAVDDDSRRGLAQQVFGDPAVADTMLQDLMREIANTGGGAFKRALVGEGHSLTTGLPEDEHTPPSGAGIHRRWRTRLGQGLSLCWTMSVVRRTPRRLAVSALHEGMVLTNDVRNECGVLLLPKGTRLTVTSIERLTKLLSDKFLVDVAAAT